MESCFSDINQMYSLLENKFSSEAFPEARKALPFAREKHDEQFRKGEDKSPYIIHPLTMTCHALAMGLEEDALLAALLLHDVCEDCGIASEDLPVCREAQEIVRLVTKPEDRKNFSEDEYYGAISRNPKACLVKCIDRCNNVSGMADGFQLARMQEYIKETETYYPELLKVLEEQPKYKNAAWLLRYQIDSVLQTAKKIT